MPHPIPIVRYKYIHFDQCSPWPKAEWICKSNRDNFPLGHVLVYSAWKEFCFFPAENVVLSSGCMEDIQRFIMQVETAALERTS